jgi:hypothetical protein
LNGTYIAYGSSGKRGAERQRAQDANAGAASPSVAVERAAAKASGQYHNESWDLVDAKKAGMASPAAMPVEQLPAEKQTMKPAEREEYVAGMAKKRADLQARIQKLQEDRRRVIAREEAKRAADQTLETAILRSIKTQAASGGYDMGL